MRLLDRVAVVVVSVVAAVSKVVTFVFKASISVTHSVGQVSDVMYVVTDAVDIEDILDSKELILPSNSSICVW